MNAPLLAAASSFACAAAYGARVGLREGVPGEPLGLQTPGTVARQLAVGLGCGTSSPWPMPLAALVAALRAPSDGAGSGASREGHLCLLLGAAVFAGVLAEPVTWERRPSTPAVTRAIALHLLSAAALVLAGRRAVHAPRHVR